jgi:hypothetical protein
MLFVAESVTHCSATSDSGDDILYWYKDVRNPPWPDDGSALALQSNMDSGGFRWASEWRL